MPLHRIVLILALALGMPSFVRAEDAPPSVPPSPDAKAADAPPLPPGRPATEPIDMHGKDPSRGGTDLPPGHPSIDAGEPASAGGSFVHGPHSGEMPKFQSKPGAVDVGPLHTLAILHSGRVKPFDTFAREAVVYLTGLREFRDPSYGDPKNAVAEDPVFTVLRLVLEPDVFLDHQTIELTYLPLKEKLGLDPDRRWFAARELATPALYGMAEEAGTRMADESKRRSVPRLQKEAHELWEKVGFLADIASGDALRMVPPPLGSKETGWRTLTEMEGYSDADREKVRSQLGDLLTSFTANDAERFRTVSTALVGTLRGFNPAAYPPETLLEFEMQYNLLRPFRTAWIVYVAAWILFLLAFQFRGRAFYGLSMAVLLAGFALHTYGLYQRIVIADRAPVSNMYESMIFLAWGLVLISTIFEMVYRVRWFATVACTLSVLTLVLADQVPISSSIDPIVAVLKSYWLTYHVLTMMLSYSAITLAAGIAHVHVTTAGFLPRHKAILPNLARFLYRVVQVGVLLLAIGLILGAVWASESWGRYWGWDAKEVWALITLLWYVAILHGRHAGWLREFGVAWCSALGFPVLLMTYYGVNYVLPALGIKSLHAYAGGETSIVYGLGAYLGIELLFLGAAALGHRRLTGPPVQPAAPPMTTPAPEMA